MGGQVRRARAAGRSFRRSGSAGAAPTSAQNVREHRLPELPEVETTARSLRPRLVGQRVVAVDGVDWPRMLPNTSEAELQSELIGHQVECVDRKGKYLLIGFDDDTWLVVHRKMSGNLLFQPRETA